MSADLSAPLVDEYVDLQPYNTLAISATARWFSELDHSQQIPAVIEFLKARQCPLLILGGGSNIVLAEDFAGLALQVKLKGLVVERETEDSVYLSVGAGENWHETVLYCVEQGWYGLENLALIPGSVGAAPIQNIGAYGVELEQCFAYLEAAKLNSGETVTFSKEDCGFGYRESVFKGQYKDQFLITRVVLKLSKTPRWVLDYPALKEHLGSVDQERLTSQQVANTVMDIRNSKLPKPEDIPNAGSFFKNPVVSPECYQRILQAFPKVVAYPQYDKASKPIAYKLAAGWLIDNAGWKGRECYGLQMHQRQALVLTNPNRAGGRDLLRFVAELKEDIFRLYGVDLEVEPRIYQAA